MIYGKIEDWLNKPLGSKYSKVLVDGIYLKRNWHASAFPQTHSEGPVPSRFLHPRIKSITIFTLNLKKMYIILT